MNIVAIVGSPRLGGNTDFLVEQALAEAGNHGIETEKIMLGQYNINPCLGHESEECASFSSCPQDDDAGWILDKLIAADGVILASPVYFYNISAQMKALIDRNRFLRRHDIKLPAKSAALIAIAASSGLDDALGALKRYATSITRVPPENMLTLSGYAQKAGEARGNVTLIQKARQLGEQMAKELTGASS